MKRPIIFTSIILLLIGIVYHHLSTNNTEKILLSSGRDSPEEVHSTNAISSDDKSNSPNNIAINDTDKVCATLRCMFPDTDSETIIKNYVKGNLGLEISAQKNRYYYETNKDFVLSQAKLGDWDAIELLLKRLDPHSVEVSDRVISSNNESLAEYYAEQRQLYHEFYIDDVEQRMQAFHEIVVIAAAYGRTAPLDYSQRYEWSGKKAMFSGKLASLYDEDTDSSPFFQRLISKLSEEEQDRLKSDAKALHQEVENKRKELGISSSEVKSLAYALNYARSTKKCTSFDSPDSLACLIEKELLSE